MRKFVLATLAVLTIGTAAFVQSADAACWWNGFAWHCRPYHSAWWWRHHHWGPYYSHYWGRYYGYYGGGHGPHYYPWYGR
jgi:hypothetical protein